MVFILDKRGTQNLCHSFTSFRRQDIQGFKFKMLDDKKFLTTSFSSVFFFENWFLIPFLRVRQPHDVCHCQVENIVISQIIFYFIRKNLTCFLHSVAFMACIGVTFILPAVCSKLTKVNTLSWVSAFFVRASIAAFILSGRHFSWRQL